MKIKVIDIFRDKFTGEVYNPGTILDFEDETRVKDLSERKLVAENINHFNLHRILLIPPGQRSWLINRNSQSCSER